MILKEAPLKIKWMYRLIKDGVIVKEEKMTNEEAWVWLQENSPASIVLLSQGRTCLPEVV